MVGINSETLWQWLAKSRKRGRSRNCTSTREKRDKYYDDLPSVTAEGGSENEEKELFRLRIGGDEENNEPNGIWKEREIFLSRVTHLHLEGKGITHIENLSGCPEARVAYLQHNHLTRLSNLRPLHHLRELYLQDNHITRLEGLRELHSLRRLFIPGNRVGVVEGLPKGLEELHIQNQRLPQGDTLVLDPHALATVQATLRLLDITGNRLMEFGAVGLLAVLKVLRAEDNDLDALSHVTAVVSRLSQLQELHLTGNPVTAHRRYHTSVVLASSPSLVILDKKRITPLSRDFIVQAECQRISVRKKAQQRGRNAPRITEVSTETHLLFTSTTHIASHEPPATAPSFVLGSIRRPEFDMILNRAQKQQNLKALLNTREKDIEEEDHPNDADDNGATVENPPEEGNPSSEKSLVPAQGFPLEKSVWFAAEEEQVSEEIPRFIPRPYWRNKPPASKC